ncbi:protein of unknown function [Pseudomonas sp. JV241A]|nr:protein of unknown function [Pseudomonas sp. JV241A]
MDRPESHAWLLHDVLALISPQTVFRLARDSAPLRVRARPYSYRLNKMNNCKLLQTADYFGRLVPYFERPWLRPLTPEVSREPRTVW